MAYEAYEWANGEDGGTPITADRLNSLEQGVAEAHDREVAASDVTDSGSTGRDVLRASLPDEARDAINAASASDLADALDRISALENGD